MLTPRKILLMMSGSIACAKATGLVSLWVKKGHRVRIACTHSVPEFVGHAILEGLSGEPVFGDTFEAGRAMDHIQLAQWADVIVACPATSNLIGKLANGIADDAVTTLWQAAWGRNIPQFVVPAMNTHMWDYPATRENVSRLKSWGIHVLPTADGDLACGERGAGRMLEPETIDQTIDALITFDQAKPSGRVLITGGGTREPIDDVRFIGNLSTGRTSAALADHFNGMGLNVTWLGANGAIEPGETAEQVRFESYGNLETELHRLLAERDFDLVVHAAAVSDFSVVRQDSIGSPQGGKLPSGQELTLRLAPNPKLLNRIRAWSRNPDVVVAGFKLTSGADDKQAKSAVQKLLDRGDVDLVVHNDLDQIRKDNHGFNVYDRQGLLTRTCSGTPELARVLADQLISVQVEEKSS